ncbi:MAG TPA: LamG domain-containing protein, partial [Bryobacterales bacterium]|nr:LamG domain-containing protein [Bryobacterales bacterium]
WHFDDSGSTLADSSGNGHAGAITGTAITTGVLNSARSFNGLADFAGVPASDAFSPASFTVRTWLKLLSYPTAAGWGVALANYGGNYQGWYLGVRSSGQIILSVASLPASSPWMLSSEPLALDRWYYVAATYDGATRLATIYIDGVADTPLYLPGFTPAPATDLDFARASWYNGYYLDAAIDETRVYPAAKTAAAILSDFQSFPAQPPAVAVAEWKLDDAGSTLTDSSGNGHTGAAHGTAIAAGIVNSARSFNGATDSIDVPASAALSPASFTIRAWVKLLSLPSGWGAVVANYGGNYQGWYVGIHSSGRVIFSVSTLPSSSPWLLSSSALALNTWYCITAAYDGSTGAGTIYIDGGQDAQAVFPGFTPQSAADLFLGRASWYDGYYLNAVIDEVRLLGFAQSPAEALADFQSFP